MYNGGTDLSHARALARHEAFFAQPPRTYTERAIALEPWAQATMQGNREAALCLHRAVERWRLDDADATRFRSLLRRFAKGVGCLQVPPLSGSAALNRTGYQRARAGFWEQARALFSTAADDGSVSAMNNLAYCLQRGLGGKRDLRRAACLFETSLAAQSCAALVNRAFMAHYGLGAAPDMATAVAHLRQAQVLGDADAGRYLVYLVYAARVASRDIGFTAREQVSLMFAKQSPYLRPPWLFELRGTPKGSQLDRKTWAELRALGPLPSFKLWRAPLIEALHGEEVVPCPRCGRKRLCIVDPDEQPLGCFACLAKGRFFNPWGADLCERMQQTPSPLIWNKEGWFRHCDADAVFLGDFTREDFHFHAPDGDGEGCFAAACAHNPHCDCKWNYHRDVREDMGTHCLHWLVFACPRCGAMAAYPDAN